MLLRDARRSDLIILALLCLAVWCSHFWYSAAFGFYEDDYWRVTVSMSQTASEVGARIIGLLRDLAAAQGRPLHGGLIRLFSYLGAQLGGKPGVYFLAYCWVSINVLLFYSLLKRITSEQAFVWFGSIAFALYPADTTQAFLTHAFGVQPSILFLLLAAHLYLSGRRILPYLLATLSLFCYETLYLVFLAVPLLKGRWGKQERRELAIHGAVTMGIFGVAVILRKLFGEGRLESMALGEMAGMALAHMAIGPGVSLSSYFWRPAEVLGAMKQPLAWFASVSAVVFFVWFSFLRAPASQAAIIRESKKYGRSPEQSQKAIEKARSEDRAFLRQMGWWMLTGVVMVILAYPLTFTTPATDVHGRGTRVHIAAMPGAALFLGALLSAGFRLAARRRAGTVAVVLLGGLFGLLVASGVWAQQAYADSWRVQRTMWTSIIKLTPEFGPGVTVLVDVKDPFRNREIPFWSWSTEYIARQIYKYDPAWKTVPTVFRLDWNWRDEVLASGDIRKIAVGIGDREALMRSQVVLLSGKATELRRVENPLVIKGKVFKVLDMPPPGGPKPQKNFLYDYLILE